MDDCLKDLITKHGDSGNIDKEDKSTLLHVSSLFGITDVVEILIEIDSSGIYARNSDNKTPLYYAASMGFPKIVLALLKNNSESNLGNGCFYPLNVACENEHVEIVTIFLQPSLLVQYNVLPLLPSPLHIACANGNPEIVELLLNWKSPFNPNEPELDINQMIKHGAFTPLHIASCNGHATITEILIRNNAVINAQTSNGATPLCMATKEGHASIVRNLLRHSAAVNLHGNRGDCPSALYSAAEKGYVDIVKMLLQHNASLDYLNEYDNALSTAVRHGHDDVLNVFLEKGAYFAAHITTDCLLHLACTGPSEYEKCLMKNKKATVQLLLDYTKDINSRNSSGCTPLLNAIRCEDIEICELLISRGASVDYPDNSGCTPLLAAAWTGSEKIVKLLLQNKANINYQLKNGCTALHKVCASVNWKGKTEMIKSLLSNGADINICNYDNYTPFDTAVETGDLQFMPLLLELGANLDEVGKTGKTPLYIACANGRTNAVKMLLEYNANVNKRCVDGSTALHAILYGQFKRVNYNDNKYQLDVIKIQTEIIKLLLERGVEINQVDNDNQTVLHTISTTNKTTLAGLLMEQRPNPYIKTRNDSTILHIACKHDNSDMVSCLINYVLDYDEFQMKEDIRVSKTCDDDNCEISLISACDHEGQTPLHIACGNGSKK